MREIRFRGKCIEDCELKGQWLYGHYLKSASHFIAVDQGLVDGHFKLYQVDPETVGQSTGLKDKNGKEIYEGDIVEEYYTSLEISRYKVEWAQESAMWLFNDGIDRVFAEDIDFSLTEVKGNKWDHPHLLKGEES